MDIYGNKLGNHALPNIFLSFCPSLSPVDRFAGDTCIPWNAAAILLKTHGGLLVICTCRLFGKREGILLIFIPPSSDGTYYGMVIDI